MGPTERRVCALRTPIAPVALSATRRLQNSIRTGLRCCDDSEEPPMSQEMALPDLQGAMLSSDALMRYLDELIGAQVEVVITIKGASQARQAPGEGLSQLREALVKREIHSAQLRYRYQGAHWVDTVMLQAEGARLVRMQVGSEKASPGE